MIIIFIGPPASGKGTQALLISSMLKLPYFSTGNVLREVAKGNSEESNELRLAMTSGKLVSSDLVNKLVYNTLSSSQYKKGAILDGYPRNLIQATFLDSKIADMKYKVVFFDISYEDLLSRVSSRYSCAECGAIYNKITIPTKIENECDMCGSHKFITREDDNLNIFESRWHEYMEQTMPLVDYYNSKSCLIKIDATMKKEDITYKLLTELKRN